MKLTVIGGGGFRVPLIYRALLADEAGPPVDEVVLHDLDAGRLRVITKVLEQLAGSSVRAPAVTATRDLDRALDDADFVFSAIRVGGLAGRVADERVARNLGMLGQETTGAGGVSYGLRTVPVALRIAEQVRHTAPDAWVINFTNPAGMVTEAMSAVLGDRVIGICDSPRAMCRRVARAVGVAPELAQFDYVGLNHLGWLRRVDVAGRDVLPALLGDDDRLGSFEEGRLFGPDRLRALGAVPNEYLWYWYFHSEAVSGDGGRTRGEFLLGQQQRFYGTVDRDPTQALDDWERVRRERDATYLAESRHGGALRNEEDVEGGGYEKVALAVMAAITNNERSTHILNVRNRGSISAMDTAAVVELPCVVDVDGAHPMPVGPVEDHQLGLIRSVKAVERETIAAAAERSRERALWAFALHPMVGSIETARQLLAGYERAVPELAELLR
ncbi:MAG TPA: 6-phospho-beta-glucosidase [Jiangellaceae bacterium]|nr:6-phospho-beta-glucosidase [Jiangellaceae bacterium]